jgi:hypothetical protein
MKTANIYETARLVMAFLEKIQKNFNKHVQLARQSNTNEPEPYAGRNRRLRHDRTL